MQKTYLPNSLITFITEIVNTGVHLLIMTGVGGFLSVAYDVGYVGVN